MNHRTLFIPAVCELREADGAPVFHGEPVVYDQWSDLICGYFKERMLPGCFDECLDKDPDILALVDHDPCKLLGRTKSGTLKIERTATGLSIEVPSPGTSFAKDLELQMRRGDVAGMSFAFDVLDDIWGRTDGVPTRDVKRAILYEVTFTGIPAYPQSSAGVRSVRGTSADDEALLALKQAHLRACRDALRVRECY